MSLFARKKKRIYFFNRYRGFKPEFYIRSLHQLSMIKKSHPCFLSDITYFSSRLLLGR
uniref:Uncharacterized protein n=1 Tax=Arundo donax TaxID=35708 RepID=A0A0A9CMP8_ARUDO